MYTFYGHLQAIGDVDLPDEYPGDDVLENIDWPVGALTLSILAVREPSHGIVS